MYEFQTEGVFDYISKPLSKVHASGVLYACLLNFKVARGEALDVEIDITTVGLPKQDIMINPPGTVRVVSGEINIEYADGSVAVAKGILQKGDITIHSMAGEHHTTERCTANSIEYKFSNGRHPAYLIEWIDNLDNGLIYPETVNGTKKTELVINIGKLSQIQMSNSTTLTQFSNNALYLNIMDTPVYVVKIPDQNGRTRMGQIIYQTATEASFREKIRHSLSFILGLPIVFYGYTEFDVDWNPVCATAISAFSLDGAMLKLHRQPPYPIEGKYKIDLNPKAIESAVNRLVANYDDLRFRDLSWSYWHAVCAPIHIAAAQFGALVEQLHKAPATLHVAPILSSLIENST